MTDVAQALLPAFVSGLSPRVHPNAVLGFVG
jgi:hypothetical protein